MDVILLNKVANLGDIGDRVDVKSGYGRNFLLPQGKATLATPSNVAKFEARRAELEKLAKDQFAAAQLRSTALEGFTLRMAARAGSEGKLFGSVGTADIAEACSAQGHKVPRGSAAAERPHPHSRRPSGRAAPAHRCGCAAAGLDHRRGLIGL